MAGSSSGNFGMTSRRYCRPRQYFSYASSKLLAASSFCPSRTRASPLSTCPLSCASATADSAACALRLLPLPSPAAGSPFASRLCKTGSDTALSLHSRPAVFLLSSPLWCSLGVSPPLLLLLPCPCRDRSRRSRDSPPPPFGSCDGPVGPGPGQGDGHGPGQGPAGGRQPPGAAPLQSGGRPPSGGGGRPCGPKPGGGGHHPGGGRRGGAPGGGLACQSYQPPGR
mmetsp:Transcript_81463/g.252854  ORF Transcript_81463/g.252854 Transcript_81463/m.252854 type:complete len:225 (+) Transcript_81463:532-1206(+)